MDDELSYGLADFLAEWRSSSPWLTVHTSGSTGKPKPIRVSKRSMEQSARATCDFLGLHAGQSALLCLPVRYIAGKMLVVRSLVRKLRLIDVPPSNRPLAGLRETPDFAAMVPSQVHDSLLYEAQQLRDIGQLIIGGGPVSDELQAAVADFPHAVWSTYGMTETLSHIALRRLNGPRRSAWYTCFSGVRLSLTAEGCLVIHASWAIQQPLVTNDLAELLPDGRFRILGRRDNTICSGGIKIQIEEVERRLASSIDVSYLVTWVPDEKFGQCATLLYESEADRPDLAARCRERLPRYCVPHVFLRVSHLPQTPTGKPARAAAQRLATALYAQRGGAQREGESAERVK